VAGSKQLARVVILGTCAIFIACADEPEPRHPTHAHHSKKHKKHRTDDSDDVVITDDPPTTKRDRTDTDVAHKTDDNDKSDVEDTDVAKTKKRKHSKRHDSDESKQDETKHDETKQDEAAQDDDEPKPKHSKRHDSDEAKQDEAKPDEAKHDEAKQDEDAPKPKPRPHRTSKHKRVVAQRAANDKAPDDTAVNANEIEMGDDDGSAEPSSPDADAGNAVAAAAPAPAIVTSPLAINDRTLIVRHGALDVHGGLRTLVLTLPTATPGMTTTNTAEALALGATYGIGDKVEIGADYTASLSPAALKGPLTVHGAYLALVGPKLDVAVAAALAVDFLDPTTTAYGLQFGGWVRYRVAPKLALFTGLPALPSETVSLSKQAFALPPLPYQLAVGLSSGSAIALDLPVGVGYQVTPAVYTFAMTDLAHVRISNTQTALLFADFIPLTVGGFYSRDKLDLGATLADDLKQGAGYLSFQLVARYAIP
jgi:hypothetical protein